MLNSLLNEENFLPIKCTSIKKSMIFLNLNNSAFNTFLIVLLNFLAGFTLQAPNEALDFPRQYLNSHILRQNDLP